jgi:hypothetical protein
MKSNRYRIALFVLLSVAGALAAPPAAAPHTDRLDQKRIHADYNDGNFEKVIASLEGFMAAHKTYSFDDSVFIAKHLAVVYTANPETREKGKYYMYRLLSLLPSAKLVDMFVSDEIDRIFDKVREEFMTRQKSFGVDTAKMSVPARSPNREARETETAPVPAAPARPIEPPEKSGGHKTAYLVAGGAGLIVVGVAAYLIFNSTPKDKVYKVP